MLYCVLCLIFIEHNIKYTSTNIGFLDFTARKIKELNTLLFLNFLNGR